MLDCSGPHLFLHFIGGWGPPFLCSDYHATFSEESRNYYKRLVSFFCYNHRTRTSSTYSTYVCQGFWHRRVSGIGCRGRRKEGKETKDKTFGLSRMRLRNKDPAQGEKTFPLSSRGGEEKRKGRGAQQQLQLFFLGLSTCRHSRKSVRAKLLRDLEVCLHSSHRIRQSRLKLPVVHICCKLFCFIIWFVVEPYACNRPWK